MKILVVDDDEITTDLIESILSATGYEVRTAGNGATALAAFGSFAPDVVITDIEMPRMNGLELLAEIRKANSETIVVVATAYGSEEYALKALRARANNYLKKPVEPTQLLAMMRQYGLATDARRKERTVAGFITDSTLSMTFGNCLELVYDIVDYLIDQAGRHIAGADVALLRLGLGELITNAIEHGNLGITYEMKTQAMHGGSYANFLEQRRADPAYFGRNVRVQARIDGRSCAWTIADDGEGFDWKRLPAEVTPDNLFSIHGRGIMLARLNFDSLEYLGCGNQVRVTKQFSN